MTSPDRAGEALLLMDLQNGIIDRFREVEDSPDRVVATQERAERDGVLVILVRVGFRPGHPEVSDRNRSLAESKAAGRLLLGDASTEPHARLLRGRGEIVVTKKRVSAFAGSDLEHVLRT